jgi:farnesyl diphosphate synthase
MLEVVSDDRLTLALKEVADELHNKMDRLLPETEKGRVGENRLAEAMRYSVLSPGKRLRPFLVVCSSDLFGVSRSSSLQVASAIEFIHAYSLIHDDLPALDNDDLRRGEPSCHKKFDEATAILAGDALLTFAFEVLADPSAHRDSGVRGELIQNFARACGPRGMVGGQMIDLISEERELSLDQTTRLQRLKTGALFALSCESGAILGKAPQNLRNALKGYAKDIGLAFQIRDDLLDAKSSKEGGDKERQDKSSEKATYVSALGYEKAKRQAEILCDQAVEHLEVFGKRAELLRELARFVVQRQK